MLRSMRIIYACFDTGVRLLGGICFYEGLLKYFEVTRGLIGQKENMCATFLACAFLVLLLIIPSEKYKDIDDEDDLNPGEEEND